MISSDRLNQALDRHAETFGAQQPLPDAYAATLVRSRQLRRRRTVSALAAAAGVAAIATVTITPAMLAESGVPDTQPASGASLTAEALPRSPLMPREAAAQAWTGGELVIWGGATASGSGNLFDDGAVYDPASGKWTKLPDGPLSARKDAAAVWTGSLVVVAGGRTETTPLAEAAVFDPAARTWTALPDSPNCPQHAVAVGEAVYAYGGCGDAPYFAALREPDSPQTASWEELTRAPIQDVRQLLAWRDQVVALNSLGQTATYTPADGWREMAGVPEVPAGELAELAVAEEDLYALTSADEGRATQVWVWSGQGWEKSAIAEDVISQAGPGAVVSGDLLAWGTDSGLCSYSRTEEDTSCLLSQGAGRSGTQLVAADPGRVLLWGGRIPSVEGPLSASGLTISTR